MSRPSWHKYFKSICDEVSLRGTCNRRQVGCILVKDKRILATGYNGAIVGAKHCDEIGHLMVEEHCIRTVHAEINALAQCAKYGIACEGAIAYINTFPCFDCFKALINAGITEIYYSSEYESEGKNNVKEFAQTLHIGLHKL